MESIDKLKKLVIQHQVCYQIFPARELIKNKIRKVGFNLEIYTPSPGCKDCVKVYEDIYKIAKWILSEEGRKSEYQFRLFSGDIGYIGLRLFRPEMSIRIELRQKEIHFGTIDELETKYLDKMIEKLDMLGAKKEEWRG